MQPIYVLHCHQPHITRAFFTEADALEVLEAIIETKATAAFLLWKGSINGFEYTIEEVYPEVP